MDLVGFVLLIIHIQPQTQMVGMSYVSGWQELYLKLLSRNNLLVFVTSSITLGRERERERERETHVKRKFLGTLGRNGAPSSHGKPHHEFNE